MNSLPNTIGKQHIIDNTLLSFRKKMDKKKAGGTRAAHKKNGESQKKPRTRLCAGVRG